MSAHGEYVYNWRLQRDQQLWEEQMFDKQTSWDLEQWKRENEYNTPVNQMNRLTAAGINPNLAAQSLVGAGNAAGGLTATAPSFGANGAGNGASLEDYLLQGANGLNQSIQTYLAGEQQRAQIKYLESQTEKTNEETVGLSIDNTYRPAANQANLDVAKANVNQMMSQGYLNRTEAKQINEMLPYMKGRTTAEIVELTNRAIEHVHEMNQIDEKINLLKEQQKTEQSEQYKNYEQGFEAHQSGVLKAAQAQTENELRGARKENLEADTALKKSQKVNTDQDTLNKKSERRGQGLDNQIKAYEAQRVKKDNEWKQWQRDAGYDPDDALPGMMISLVHKVGERQAEAFGFHELNIPKYFQENTPEGVAAQLLPYVMMQVCSPADRGVQPQNVQGSGSYYNPYNR